MRSCYYKHLAPTEPDIRADVRILFFLYPFGSETAPSADWFINTQSTTTLMLLTHHYMSNSVC